MRSVVSEASSAHLTMPVQPVASTPPMIHHMLISGAFHGMMPPTTPTGALSVSVVTWPGRELGIVVPVQFSAWLAK